MQKAKIKSTPIQISLALSAALVLWPSYTFATLNGGSFQVFGETVLPVAGSVSGGIFTGTMGVQPAVAGQVSSSNLVISIGIPLVGSNPSSIGTVAATGGGGGLTPALLPQPPTNSPTQTPSSTPEQDPPSMPLVNLTRVEVRFITGTTATLVYETDALAKGSVSFAEIGKPYRTTEQEKAYNYTHSVRLNGLKPGTEYSFAITLENQAGKSNQLQSPTYVFQTQKETSPLKVDEDHYILEQIPPVTEVTAVQDEHGTELTWKNPEFKNFAKVIVVRSNSNYADDPSKGDIVYEGSAQTFLDTLASLTNPNFYSIFVSDLVGDLSIPTPIRGQVISKKPVSARPGIVSSPSQTQKSWCGSCMLWVVIPPGVMFVIWLIKRRRRKGSVEEIIVAAPMRRRRVPKK